MAEIVLITGGARSGKSRFAQSLAEEAGKIRTYLATCPVPDMEYQDGELVDRISRHKRDRQGRDWQTVEETTDLAGVLGNIQNSVVLVDCLTLWVNNLLYEKKMDEDAVVEACSGVIDVCQKRTGIVIFVTNEVGCGIVPDNELARMYRDCVGRCNQTFGRAADRVVFISCGQAMVMKDDR